MIRPIKIADQSDREAWLSTRFDYITASDVPSIMGKNKYCSPRKVFETKINKISSDIHHRHEARGHESESLLLDMFTFATQIKSHHCSATFNSPKYPWLACSPDAIARMDGETRLIEVKAPARPAQKEKVKQYMLQTMCQMLVMGYATGHVLIGTPTLEWFDPLDEPMEPLPYKDYMIACGLPYYSFGTGEFIESLEPPKAKIVYQSFGVITITAGEMQGVAPEILDRTKRFYDAMQDGYLDIDLW